MLNQELLKQEYGYMDGHVYLDWSKVGMPAKRITDAARVFMDGYVATYNSDIKNYLISRRNDAKKTLARCINGDPSDFTFVKNTTEGNSIFAMGYQPLVPGTNAIVVDTDFPNTICPWINASHVRGFDLKVYHTDRGAVPADDIIAMMDENTKVVALAAVQSGYGYFVDLKKIGVECRKRGIAFAVDAFQAIGRMTIDVTDCCIDYLTCGAFKALGGAFGSAFVYSNKETIQKVTPQTVAYQGTVGYQIEAPYRFTNFGPMVFKDSVDRLEAGSQCTYAAESLTLGVKVIEELGHKAVEAHILELEDYIREKLAELPLDVYTYEKERRSGIIAMTFPENLTDKLKPILEKYQIRLSLRPGILRICIAAQNTKEHMDVFYQAMKEWLDE